MDKTMEITVKRRSGTFPLVVVVGEDGEFYKVTKTLIGGVRHILVAGIIKDGKIAFGMRYYMNGLSRDGGQELYAGRIGGNCEAVINITDCIYEWDVEIGVKEDIEYAPRDVEIMSYNDADLQERSYLTSVMLAAKNSFRHIN